MRSQAVTWRTSADVPQGMGEIAVAGEGPLFVEGTQKVKANTVRLEGDLGAAHYHTVEFIDLKPGTKYAYRVGDGKVFSEWSHFTTANDWAKPFTFIYVGDAQNDIKSHWSRVIRSAFTDAPKAAFVIHAGDLINRANRDGGVGRVVLCDRLSASHDSVYCHAGQPRVLPSRRGQRKRVVDALAADVRFSEAWAKGAGRNRLLRRLPGSTHHRSELQREAAGAGDLAERRIEGEEGPLGDRDIPSSAVCLRRGA